MQNVISTKGGFSLLEVIVSLAILALVLGIAAANFRPLENPVITSSNNLSSHFGLIRTRAIATTSAFEVTPVSSKSLQVSRGMNCGSMNKETDTTLSFTLPGSVVFTETDWAICFNSRGLADGNIEVKLSDGTITRTIEVMLGGGSKVL